MEIIWVSSVKPFKANVDIIWKPGLFMIGKQINGLVSKWYSIGVKCVNDKIYMSFRGVFRNLSNIYDGAFYEDSGLQ